MKANQKPTERAKIAEKIRLMQEREFEQMSKTVLLAAFVRRFGGDDGAGGKTLTLSKDDIQKIPPNERLTIEPADGASLKLTISYPVPEPTAAEGSR